MSLHCLATRVHGRQPSVGFNAGPPDHQPKRLRPVVSQAKEARAPVCLRLMQNPQILQAAAGMEKNPHWATASRSYSPQLPLPLHKALQFLLVVLGFTEY
ncbi:peroxynitrite isomerase THAP4-like [Ixodes scapularis]